MIELEQDDLIRTIDRRLAAVDYNTTWSAIIEIACLGVLVGIFAMLCHIFTAMGGAK